MCYQQEATSTQKSQDSTTLPRCSEHQDEISYTVCIDPFLFLPAANLKRHEQGRQLKQDDLDLELKGFRRGKPEGNKYFWVCKAELPGLISS